MRAAQRKVAVRLKAIQKDHTVREVVAGAPGGDSLTLVRYNLTDPQTIRRIAEEEVNKWRYDGYEGSLTGWLLPYCTYGWHARIIDPDYPERQGTYLIERVQSRISMQGRAAQNIPRQKNQPMNQQEQLTEAFRRLSRGQPAVAAAQVVSVQERTCTVRFLTDGTEAAGICLQATEKDNDDHLIVYPQVGSNVWVLLLDEERQGLVVSLDEPDRLSYQKGSDPLVRSRTTSRCTQEIGKLQLKNNAQSLKALLTQVKELLGKIASAAIPGMPGAPAGYTTIATGLAALEHPHPRTAQRISHARPHRTRTARITLDDADNQHAKDLISCCKGWDKFHPFVGACLPYHLHDEQALADELLSAIRREINEDGGSVRRLAFTDEGTTPLP